MTDDRLKPGHCHKCGLPMSDNPHPEAGKPGHYLDVGCPRECIPCVVKSRHQWADRAMKAENELRDLQAARATPADLMERFDHIDQQGYVHWKMSNDTKGPRSIDDATGRDRSVPGTSTQNDPKLSPGQCAIEEAVGKLHIAASQLTDPKNVSGLILEAIDKLNWISANPESFSATPADQARVISCDPADPGYDVETLREHVRALENRIQSLHREKAARATPADHSVPVAWPRLTDEMARAFYSAYNIAHEHRGAYESVLAGYAAMQKAAPQSPQKDADHIEAQSVPVATIDLIIRDVCEDDPADADAPDTVCISVSDLRLIIERHIGHSETPSADTEEAESLRAFYKSLCDGYKHDLESYTAGYIDRSRVPQSDAQSVRDAWKPIETAPRDGRNILIRFGRDGVSQAMYVPGVPHPWKFIDTNDGVTWLINSARDGEYGPSHWMPMPAPPQNIGSVASDKIFRDQANKESK